MLWFSFSRCGSSHHAVALVVTLWLHLIPVSPVNPNRTAVYCSPKDQCVLQPQGSLCIAAPRISVYCSTKDQCVLQPKDQCVLQPQGSVCIAAQGSLCIAAPRITVYCSPKDQCVLQPQGSQTEGDESCSSASQLSALRKQLQETQVSWQATAMNVLCLCTDSVLQVRRLVALCLHMYDTHMYLMSSRVFGSCTTLLQGTSG
jgi:hypothetical protein